MSMGDLLASLETRMLETANAIGTLSVSPGNETPLREALQNIVGVQSDLLHLIRGNAGGALDAEGETLKILDDATIDQAIETLTKIMKGDVDAWESDEGGAERALSAAQTVFHQVAFTQRHRTAAG